MVGLSIAIHATSQIGAGAVMYIDLRFIPHDTPLAQKGLYQSCYALGGWPFANEPDWSKEIPVVPNHLSARRDNEYERCMVALVEMEIRTTTRDSHNRAKTRTSEISLFNKPAAARKGPVSRFKGKFFGGQEEENEHAKRGKSSTQKEKGRQEVIEPEWLNVLLDTGACNLSHLHLEDLTSMFYP
ncbi:hypothetical protein PYCCODRAFT_981938 [Trametes coccinea BRFM310]|uniref:Uncharacterized protein n=1 Tax=Trametes coccinea (strain BRFM310) TaxID=1353009 RepID=A0A1Y2IBK6_TRAC3|nr:hypothetical protein PYCCODRAFT_981938 [Trametes coccinea BRFM310]